MSWEIHETIGALRPYPSAVTVRKDFSDEVLRYVPERTCYIDKRVPDAPFCSRCAYDWNDDWCYCPNCGCKAEH